ncbi:undecaprenyl-diphosphate phosphatase [Qipengyuania flava]|uniref:undecaprenyl-diphosphate phosphatase n=1 Tax=Qipengyuania TaxID=1855416 RepID=UPI001C872325|nr:undecaprenyl-diphosphate phosphatase [Qipengyuania aestuarii]MBX7535279.1 undecaprenyl-diphosphate phosphatase [Qipengyuania aestuarii]MCA0978567.1 undecaprenyl-diphosphate phosphatase [Qipengyuania flava]
MTFLQELIIAIVQGITEFLPISSSGHLILIPKLTDFPDQGPLIDVAVHVGSLLAIILYFWKDVLGLARGGFASVGLGKDDEQRRLFWFVLIGTIPAVAVGLFIKTGGYLEGFRSTDLVATNLIIFGILLGLADRFGKQTKAYEDMTLRDAILVGCAQALALIPGTSRSGSTMTAARALGYTRVESARFSFLLAIPAVAGAGLLAALDLADATAQMQQDALVTGVLTFFAALATMMFLMNFLKKASMLVFVIYRVILGSALLLFL